MNKSQFKKAFSQGLGSAYIELKNCSSREKYKEIILWCCLHNICYDMQCEGGRGIYLYNAIKLYDDKSIFEDAIIKKFMKKKLDTWLFDQFCDLLFQFAVEGSLKARDTLYTKYDTLFALLSNKKNSYDERDSFEWLCVWLTSLDGFSIFKRIVNQLGELLISTRDRNACNLDWFYSNAKNKFGKKRVDNYLHNNAKKSQAVDAFLKEAVRFEDYVRQQVAPPSLEELIEASYETDYRSRGIALHFARIASVEDLTKLAHIALKEKDSKIKLELLWAFQKVKFPLDERFIFELAEDDDESIRDIAFDIMKHLSSDRIHDYAVNLITSKREITNSLSLLCNCYHPDDEALLIEGVKSLPVSFDDGVWHGVFMNVEDLLDKHNNKIDPGLFIYMYRQTLCSMCRASLVKKMFKRKILPHNILEECLYDSYDDTRKFAERQLSKLTSSKL